MSNSKPNLPLNGGLNPETTERRPATQSSSAALTHSPKSQNTSATSGTTASPKNPTASQLTLNSPNAIFRMIHALATKLGALVEWQHITLKDGRVGTVLFFDATNWKAVTNGKTSELQVRSKE